jgi:hypothetical protein
VNNYHSCTNFFQSKPSFGQALHLSAQPSFNFLKIGKKKHVDFFILVKKSLITKKIQGYQLFVFLRLHHTLFDYYASFYRKKSVWVRWKGILLSKIQKIKNLTTLI